MSWTTRLVLRHPRWAAAALLAATIAFASGLPRLITDVGYRAFLGPRHPAVREFDAFLERFGGGLPMIAIWSCAESPACASALDAASLEMARRVGASLATSHAVLRVTSPATAALLLPTPRGLAARRFIEDGAIVADAARLAEQAVRDPLWAGDLVSSDGLAGAIVVDLVSSESQTAVDAYAALDSALAPFETAGFEFHRVGGPVEFVVAGAELERAMARIVPIMVALVGLTLFAVFRSVVVALVALSTVGLAVVWTLGLLGWIGWAQNSLTQTLAPLILVIGVCDGIHLISRYSSLCLERHPRDLEAERALLERAASDVGRPCWMTSVTTAAGFLSFGTAELESFVEYGVIAAFGVMAALLLTFTFLPLVLLHVKVERVHVPRASAVWRRGLRSLVDVSDAHRHAILALSLVLGVACGWGMAHLRVDSSFEELYGEESRVVRWAHFASEHLRNPDTLEIDLALPEDVTRAAPASLEAIAEAARELSAIEPLGDARSLLASPAWTQLLIAGRGSDEGLARWLDADRRHARISITSDKLPQDVMRDVMSRVRRYLAEELPDGWTGRATGPLALVNAMTDSIRTAQLRSFAAAALAVGALLSLYLRSVTWSLIALLPTALPVVVTLGAMGLLGLPLDIGSAMVAAVVLGIAVDDTIHLLEHFQRARRAGACPADAIRTAVEHVGQALVSTSVALTIGFAALTLSPWQSVASFGLISAIAILGALLADLVVLPALVLAAVRPSRGPKGRSLR
ncbi:MAG: MMPL family transporter [Deltaproteobacteria bacterium]|nr:MAG: MMPL family transporter [Deltaproteobacteria bacterium]